ncbi:YcnI family copper-binding membrane protein [Actinomadura hibisca]|uniref:YcnI family copper-binding membrane protein n=1 Tax=Actinomadura hibisca TaxID=68565 RepID=UPI000831F043|nr:YcnI family protein [Actinomadura hibisca]
MSSRMSSRLAAVSALAATSLLGLATAASAHVTAQPGTAEQGGYSKVAFRVPNERDDAGTTKLQVDLPMDHPVASVSVRPLPGWSVKVEKAKLAKPIKAHGGELTEAVSRITWSGGKIEPGQFQEFEVSMGALPTDTDRMMFKAVQTYAGGEVVKWDQDPGTGQGEEPEHPAPVLKLVPKGAATTQNARLTASAKPAAASSTDEADDGTARLLGGAGIAVGVVGIIIGGLGIARARNAGGKA